MKYLLLLLLLVVGKGPCHVTFLQIAEYYKLDVSVLVSHGLWSWIGFASFWESMYHYANLLVLAA